MVLALYVISISFTVVLTLILSDFSKCSLLTTTSSLELIKFGMTVFSSFVVILIYFGNIVHKDKVERKSLKNKKITTLLSYLDDLEKMVSDYSLKTRNFTLTDQEISLLNILSEKVFKYVETQNDELGFDPDTITSFISLNSLCSDNHFLQLQKRLYSSDKFQLNILKVRVASWKNMTY